MTETTKIQIRGVIYKKSRASAHGGGKCVGVAIRNGRIAIINTKSKGPTVDCTLEEWDAFLNGVKSGEFDAHRLPVSS